MANGDGTGGTAGTACGEGAGVGITVQGAGDGAGVALGDSTVLGAGVGATVGEVAGGVCDSSGCVAGNGLGVVGADVGRACACATANIHIANAAPEVARIHHARRRQRAAIEFG